MESANAGIRSAEGMVDPNPNRGSEKEYIPRKGELLRHHEINIKFLSVGCVVRVGCKEVPFTTIEEAMDNINAYVKNPYEVTKRWNQIFNENE